jgi:hypothetical protein
VRGVDPVERRPRRPNFMAMLSGSRRSCAMAGMEACSWCVPGV